MTEHRPARRATGQRIPISADGSLTVAARVQSWYLVGRSSELRSGKVVSRALGGRPIVLFRGPGGRAHALAAHCWHMGAHLGGGAVVGGALRCPLHHWTYDGRGGCRSAPGTDAIPAEARQRAYPVAERYGGVFVFDGPRPLFPPPSFAGPAEDGLRVGHGRAVRLRAPWFAVAANAFDKQHLETVHRRALRAPPTVERLDRYRLRLRYVSRVTGRSAADRTMRHLSGDRIAVAVTCWGGSAITVESDVGRGRSMLLLGLGPVGGGTVVTPIVGVPRGRADLVDAARVTLAGWLFSKFLERDAGILDRIRFRPRLPLPADEPLARYLDFLAGLPAAEE